MIFDDHNQHASSPGSSPHRQRRRRNSRSSFSEAAHLGNLPSSNPDGNAKAWRWVLALLVLCALGFAWFLQQGRGTTQPLQSAAPSTELLPYIDPVLAPLETGAVGYSPESLADLQSKLRVDQEAAGLDDRDIYATAATMAQILQEALEDRERHMERLVKLGSPVAGVAPAEQVRANLPEAERRHLELAVGISWQRNSGVFRNRLEELWYRLLRLEQGRFRAVPTMQELPAAAPSHE